ncbi:MAG: transcriptional regulator NrdR [bacterium]
MRCPVCNYKDTKVVDTRIQSEGLSIRRRRECEKCGYRFSTVEEVELLDITVVKRDGGRQTYDREKIVSGLKKALEKRSYTEDDFHALIGAIEREIQKMRSREVKSSDIGEIIMERLKRFDTVAYIRFASVYRQFEDVKTFEAELRLLLNKSTNQKIKKSRKRKKLRRH